MSRPLIIVAAAIAASLLAPAVSGMGTASLGGPAKRGPVLSPEASSGRAFAEQRCSACHAVTANGISPNSEAPSFEDIANRPGVTAATLRQFLSDSHNYPATMNFRVEPAQISNLADYMTTLQKADYRPDR